MYELTKVQNKETKEHFWVLKNKSSRFIEGKEFVLVKRNPEDKLSHWIKRESLFFGWR